IGGVAVAALLSFFVHGRAGAARVFGGGGLAGRDHHAIDAACCQQLFEHLLEEDARQVLALRGGQESGQALLGIGSRLYRQDGDFHRSTTRARALRCAVPDMIVFVTMTRIPSASTAGSSFASWRSSTKTSTKSR